MRPGEYEENIKLVQARHHSLHLSYEQAVQIFRFEEEKVFSSERSFFTSWEEWDYEFMVFRQILNQEQMEIYKTHREEFLRQHEASLLEMDNREQAATDIAYYKEMVTFYENQFVPDFFKIGYVTSFSWLHADQSKIAFLKAEYKRFLAEWRKETLVHHLRENRTFKPNELVVSLLRHRTAYLWPDYYSFKSRMDEPTKATADYLSRKLRHIHPDIEELLTKKLDELKAFHAAQFKKYYGAVQGWHVTIGPVSPEDQREDRIMSLLLLDKEKYGVEELYFPPGI
jgi:hypothetical protein